jgi:hypothetical protein
MAGNPAIPTTDARRLATILLRCKMALGKNWENHGNGSFWRGFQH